MRRRDFLSAVGLPFVLARAAFAQQPAVFRARPPEFVDIEAWINSKPLTLAGLKGQVVVLHFWTFG